MRIDPESPRARAKLRALDHLEEMLDYTNVKPRSKADPDAEIEQAESEVEPDDVGERHMDSDPQDREPDDLGASDDDAEACEDPRDVGKGGREMAAYKTIDLRSSRRMGGPGEMDVEVEQMRRKRR